VAGDWHKNVKDAGEFADDPGLHARRRVEQWIKSRAPSTRKGKALVAIGPIVIGPIVEHGVRALEERGPELAAAVVEKAREQLPAVANSMRTGFAWTREKIEARQNRP
jgi:hypothetical protein